MESTNVGMGGYDIRCVYSGCRLLMSKLGVSADYNQNGCSRAYNKKMGQETFFGLCFWLVSLGGDGRMDGWGCG